MTGFDVRVEYPYSGEDILRSLSRSENEIAGRAPTSVLGWENRPHTPCKSSLPLLAAAARLT